MNKNLYGILGCPANSSFEEIKQAYHRKLLEFHPDKNTNSPKHIESFYSVKAAWEILGDEKRRCEYDAKSKQDDLEDLSVIIYERLGPQDLQPTEDEHILAYPCRCGSNYLVQTDQLMEPHCIIHIPCQDCTLNVALET